MPRIEDSWESIARTLGYSTEGEMLVDLYCEQHFSLRELGHRLGFSVNSVRNRLSNLGVHIRSRGGPQRAGKTRLNGITDEQLQNIPETASKLGFHQSTLFKEKRRRKEARAELTGRSGDQVSRAVVDLYQDHEKPDGGDSGV